MCFLLTLYSYGALRKSYSDLTILGYRFKHHSSFAVENSKPVFLLQALFVCSFCFRKRVVFFHVTGQVFYCTFFCASILICDLCTALKRYIFKKNGFQWMS